MSPDTKILTSKEIDELLKEFPGWEHKQDRLAKEFRFADFKDALAFVNALAPYCDQIDHHPDVHIFYNRVLFELCHHEAGEKVTNRDFMLAEEIERLYLMR